MACLLRENTAGRGLCLAVSVLVVMLMVGVNYCQAEYCDSTYTHAADDWIAQVTFNRLNSYTGQDGSDSYGDYTSISTNVARGSTYRLLVSFQSFTPTEQVWAWFDWNGNEVFEGEGEAYDLGEGMHATLVTDVTVPLDAALGSTRMRVIAQWDVDPAPCGSHPDQFGEVEDYTVNIVEALAPIGACCDELVCTEAVSEVDCLTGGHIYHGDGTDCTSIECANPQACSTVITDFPYSESFDTGLGDWSNDAVGDEMDWTHFSGATPSGYTGPSGDHTSGSGFYLYTEPTGGFINKAARLEGPCFDLTSLANPTLTFWYHMYGSSMGTLEVEVSLNNGQSWDTVLYQAEDHGDAWLRAVADLSAYAGETISLRITGTTGNTFMSDMAIDDILVGDRTLGACCDAAGQFCLGDLTLSDCLALPDSTWHQLTSCALIDCATTEAPSLISRFPYTENFDSGLGSWSNAEAGDEIDWTRLSGATPSDYTGPSADHTNGSGFYLYTETTDLQDVSAILEGPTFDLGQVSDAGMVFWYHMYGADMGTLDMEVSEDGITWTPYWTLFGDQGNWWHPAFVDLSSLVGHRITVRFRSETGESTYGDVAIDDVQVGDALDSGGICNADGESAYDCNANGILDACDLGLGTSQDCQHNNILDECDIASEPHSQWAACVIDVSSEFDPEPPAWLAIQALGAPDVVDCSGSGRGAWRPELVQGSYEFITLGFEKAVRSNGITIREVGWNGTVTQVDVLDTDNVLHTMWSGVDPSFANFPQIIDFHVTWPLTTFLVKGVRVVLDPSINGTQWEAIDAVQLNTTDIHLMADCNANDVPDDCDIAAGTSTDVDANYVPDDCDPDCNANGILDLCDVDCGIGSCVDNPLGCGGSEDCNSNLVPDECDLDCNNNGIPDDCEIAAGGPDCNDNGVPDDCDVADGTSLDIDADGIPDECMTVDCNGNGILDRCDTDCGIGSCAESPLGCGGSEDCNGNTIPDECELYAWTHDYWYDDGTAEYGLRANEGNYLAWLNRFTVAGNARMIDAVDLAFSSSVGVEGAPAMVYLWSDPDGDGNPQDAQVLASAPTSTITTAEVFRVDLPDTYIGPDGTSFFIGVILEYPNESSYPCPLDTSVPATLGVSWFLGHEGPFDPNDLSNGALVYSLIEDSVGVGANYILRAVGLVPNGDCNLNGIPDECDIASGFSEDCLPDGIPDECQFDGGHTGIVAGADLCVDAPPIYPGIEYHGNTIGMSSDGSSSCGVSQESPDAWYRYTPASSGSATFSLCDGTSYDAVLSVHDGCPGASGADLVCGDDECGLWGCPSEVTLDVEAYRTYLIRVTGWNGSAGYYTLLVTGPECNPAAGDCDENGILDACDIAQGASDANSNGILDECELIDNDCNSDGVPDHLQLDGNDCNRNGVPDDCDAFANDCQGDGIPDDCQLYPASAAPTTGCSTVVGGTGGPDRVNGHAPNPSWTESGIIDDFDLWPGGPTSFSCIRLEMYCTPGVIVDTARIQFYDLGSVEIADLGTFGDTSPLFDVTCSLSDGTMTWTDSGIDEWDLDLIYYDLTGPLLDFEPGRYGIYVTLPGVYEATAYWATAGSYEDNDRAHVWPNTPAGVPSLSAWSFAFTLSGGNPPNDCNLNSVLDECDISDGTSIDANGNGIPDECEDGIPGDLDDDGDVDIDDFALFPGCMNGPEVGYPLDCNLADLDSDGDVDVIDFAEFQTGFGQ